MQVIPVFRANIAVLLTTLICLELVAGTVDALRCGLLKVVAVSVAAVSVAAVSVAADN
jgi:hypothetical protein